MIWIDSSIFKINCFFSKITIETLITSIIACIVDLLFSPIPSKKSIHVFFQVLKQSTLHQGKHSAASLENEVYLWFGIESKHNNSKIFLTDHKIITI
jgi:hypothetical protein